MLEPVPGLKRGIAAVRAAAASGAAAPEAQLPPPVVRIDVAPADGRAARCLFVAEEAGATLVLLGAAPPDGASVARVWAAAAAEEAASAPHT